MLTKDPELIEKIIKFSEKYMLENGKTPTTRKIAGEFNISNSTVHRYLTEMNEKGLLSYDFGVIETVKTKKLKSKIVTAPILGSIICGDPLEEEENIEEYVNLPTSIFGSGELYILTAKGNSMIDAGIDENDLVVVKRQCTANEGDLVIALDDEHRNTLKRFGGYDKDHKAILEYMNQKEYPDKVILVDELVVQGVVSKIIKNA